MQTVQLSSLCLVLGLSRNRVDQWVSRGIVDADNKTTRGAMRGWTKMDALRLLLTNDVVAAGCSTSRAEDLNHMIRGSIDGYEDYVVVFKALSRRKVTSSGVVLEQGLWSFTGALLKRDELADYLASNGVSIVVPLAPLVEMVNAAWRQISDAESET